MRTISSEDIMKQLLEIERELIELEAKFTESFGEREHDLFEVTHRKIHEIENDIHLAQIKFLQIENTDTNQSKHHTLELEPQFQV